MNKYTKNLNRIEFLVTFACTGRCKHCSEGDHSADGEHLDGDVAAEAVKKIAGQYKIESLMTFGGEPLLYSDTVCKIHGAARDVNIPKRQLITNGFFTKDIEKIHSVAREIAKSGINDVLLSVDAFHQETIPIEPVKIFAEAVKAEGVRLRTHPAWLVGKEAENPYNKRTLEILREFEQMGITVSSGNVIFPRGNAMKYLGEYFDFSKEQVDPYAENPEDMRAISFKPNGNVLGGNIYQSDILDIISKYVPK